MPRKIRLLFTFLSLLVLPGLVLRPVVVAAQAKSVHPPSPSLKSDSPEYLRAPVHQVCFRQVHRERQSQGLCLPAVQKALKGSIRSHLTPFGLRSGHSSPPRSLVLRI